MQIKEINNNSLIVLDKDEDFSNKSFTDIFNKVEKYKKLPFHDVILTMESKYFLKFWELFQNTKMNFKEAETKNNIFCIKF